MAASLSPVLEAGDRLIAALEAGDLAAASDALRARQEAIDVVLAAPPPATAGLAEAVREQEARLGTAFAAARTALHATADTARRAASAIDRYRAAAPTSVLDTKPRV